MKQPGTLVHHAGEDYLCVEGGFNAETRTISLLTTGDNQAFPHRTEDVPVTWRDQGDWYPVARWSADDVLLPDPRHHEQRELAADVIEHYLSDAGELPEAAWAITDGTGFRGHLADIMPQGLAAEVFDDLERAEEAAGGEALVPVHDVTRFLTHLAREGYAGALWNAQQPIFFCLDENDELQFLRVADGGRSGMSMELLDPLVGWEPYEGAESVDFLDNGEACDARLAESVGPIPLLDWPDDRSVWSIGPSQADPGIVTVADDGLAYALLFTDEQVAQEWLAEEIEDPWVAFPVHDLESFLAEPGTQGIGALLNPGAHRARRGVLWHDGERIVLDSFSGFWELADQGFVAIAGALFDDDEDEVEDDAEEE